MLLKLKNVNQLVCQISLDLLISADQRATLIILSKDVSRSNKKIWWL